MESGKNITASVVLFIDKITSVLVSFMKISVLLSYLVIRKYKILKWIFDHNLNDYYVNQKQILYLLCSRGCLMFPKFLPEHCGNTRHKLLPVAQTSSTPSAKSRMTGLTSCRWSEDRSGRCSQQFWGLRRSQWGLLPTGNQLLGPVLPSHTWLLRTDQNGDKSWINQCLKTLERINTYSAQL